MRKWLENLLKGEKIYLSIVLALSTYLFITGYFYIRHLNQGEEFVPKIPESQNQLAVTVIPEVAETGGLVELRLSRDRQRSRELENLNQMLAIDQLSPELRRAAEQELWRLNQASSKEREMENLLRANGFEAILVTISTKNVTVVVSEKLNLEGANIIGSLAAEISGFGLEQVRVVEARAPLRGAQIAN